MKTSLSKNLCKRSHDIGAGSYREAAYGGSDGVWEVEVTGRPENRVVVVEVVEGIEPGAKKE